MYTIKKQVKKKSIKITSRKIKPYKNRSLSLSWKKTFMTLNYYLAFDIK